jgi:protein-L-isoaspartate(D-aspartate) O-methyltransferase
LQRLAIALLCLCCRRSSLAPPGDDAQPTVPLTRPSTSSAAGGAEANEPARAVELRQRLVSGIASRYTLRNPRVLETLGRVPRHLFMPAASLGEAYRDEPFPIGYGQTISQPTIVALMTDALDVSDAHRVLEIGTGSGYQAAVLSMLVRELYSIEIVPELGNGARERLQRLGYRNVHVRVGDGYKGWPEAAPFDRILLTAAPPEVPEALVSQLKDGGLLVAPIGEANGVQTLYRYLKTGGKLSKQDLGSVRFVPMVEGR